MVAMKRGLNGDLAMDDRDLERAASYFNPSRSFQDSSSKSRICRRSEILSLANIPCFRAFWLPRGAPDRLAPPCMRQRALPCIAGALQIVPLRVRTPQRGLDCMASVLRT